MTLNLKGSLLILGTFFLLCGSAVAKCHISTSVPGKWERIQDKDECRLAKKILKWKNLDDNPDTSFEEIVEFFEKNPDWPNQVALKRKAEGNIDNDTDKDLMREWFRKNPPATHKGALAFVKVAEKQDKKSVEKIFEKVTLDQRDLKAFLRYAKEFIGTDDLFRRFNHLMYEDRVDEAQVLVPMLSKNKRMLASDRIALSKGQHRKRMATNDPGYLWQYGRYLLKGEKNDDLKNFLGDTAVKKAEQRNPEKWWDIRKILVRRYIEKKRYKDAYTVTQAAQTTEGIAFAESKWLEGWINLRFLNNSKKAYADFQDLYDKVETAISLSKAAYWAGRAAEAHKDSKKRDEWLKKAAKHRGTFYGQLAISMTEEDFLPEDYVVSKSEKREFEENELVRVIKLLKKVGNIDLSELFFWKLAIKVDKPDEHELLISLAAEVAGPHAAVQVTKIGAKHVMPVMEEAYPKLDHMLMPPLFDNYNINMQALIHAIIRKESRFKSKAQSPKGAKGLMQLLDGTARQVSRSDQIKYGSLFDPKANIALGEGYLKGLLKRYNGSLILAIAAYNAGPHRVDKWIKEYGYPGKSGKIEAVEWIQLIPFWETRDYVERVLENYWRYTISFLGVPIKNWHKKLF